MFTRTASVVRQLLVAKRANVNARGLHVTRPAAAARRVDSLEDDVDVLLARFDDMAIEADEEDDAEETGGLYTPDEDEMSIEEQYVADEG